jgi:hypothetical protein
MLPFAHIEPWIEGFLQDLRGRGLAGNIVKDRPDQLAPNEQSTWTGEQHQLALMGSAANCWLELRQQEGGHWITVRIERNLNNPGAIVLDFAVKEG